VSLEDFEELSIRAQLAIIYETLCCVVIPILTDELLEEDLLEEEG